MKTRILIVVSLILLMAQSLSAVEITPDNINFKQKPTVSGGLSFNNTFFNGSDSLIKRDPYMFTLCGSLNVNLFGVALPFSFALSNTSKSYSQPFNRFQVAPKYKWVRLYLGSTAMTFSPYTLAGRDFRGVGVELTPNNWFIGAMYGRFAKAVEYDPVENNINDVSYKRTGYAAKVGWNGSTTSVNATFFHAQDDSKSLEYYVPAEADLHPQKNTAISACIRQSFLKYFFVQAEYAFSVYNTDIRVLEELESGGSSFASKFLGKKANDRYVDALNGQIGYQGKVWGLSFCYERIAPYYQTLGGYYFTNDREDFTLSPYLKLIKGKLNLSGKFGVERNNLDNMKANDNKRIVGSASASFSGGNGLVASLSYSNFSNYTKYKKRAYPYYVDQLDTLNFYQVSRNFNAMIAYGFGDSTLTQNISLSGGYQFGNSEVGEVSTSKQNIWNGTVNYGQTFASTGINWGSFFSLNHVDIEVPEMKSLYWGPGINGGWGSKSGAVSTNLSVAYNQNSNNGIKNSSLINSNLSVTWSINGIDQKFGKHSLSANAGLTNWLKSDVRANKDYEFLASVNYSVNF
ncbi:MAG: hypothetical protein PUC42_07565 [Bacteroidales bacterium]|jgi:hypothetical protein|nr:hypothetical protein [Bacteroidales bacterium]